MRQLYFAVTSLALAASAGAQETDLGRTLGYQHPMPIGTKIEAVTAVSKTGRVTIDPRKAKATAFIFISYTCGASTSYQDYLHAMHDEYTSKGVQVVFLDSNHEDGPHVSSDTDSGNWRRNVGTATVFPPIYLDTLSEIANMVGARNTPEVYIFDSTGALRYHGAPTAQEDRKKDYTRWALDAVLAGKPVAIPVTPAFGCMIHAVDADGRQ